MVLLLKSTRDGIDTPNLSRQCAGMIHLHKSAKHHSDQIRTAQIICMKLGKHRVYCSLTGAYSSCMIATAAPKNTPQSKATGLQYSVQVRTLLTVCWIGCDIFGLHTAAHSSDGTVIYLKLKQWKIKSRLILFFQVLFGVVSYVRCYTLRLWCQREDEKGFVQSPLGLDLGSTHDVILHYCQYRSGRPMWSHLHWEYMTSLLDISDACFKLMLFLLSVIWVMYCFTFQTYSHSFWPKSNLNLIHCTIHLSFISSLFIIIDIPDLWFHASRCRQLAGLHWKAKAVSVSTSITLFCRVLTSFSINSRLSKTLSTT